MIWQEEGGSKENYYLYDVLMILRRAVVTFRAFWGEQLDKASGRSLADTLTVCVCVVGVQTRTRWSLCEGGLLSLQLGKDERKLCWWCKERSQGRSHNVMMTSSPPLLCVVAATRLRNIIALWRSLLPLATTPGHVTSWPALDPDTSRAHPRWLPRATTTGYVTRTSWRLNQHKSGVSVTNSKT